MGDTEKQVEELKKQIEAMKRDAGQGRQTVGDNILSKLAALEGKLDNLMRLLSSESEKADETSEEDADDIF